MNDNEPDAARLRQRLHDLADGIHPDLTARAASAIAAGRQVERRRTFLVPVAAAAATIVVVGASYLVVTGLPGLGGNTPVAATTSTAVSESPTASATSSAPTPTSTTPTPSSSSAAPTTTSTGPKIVNGFAVVGRQKIDLDGDGRPDTVTLLDQSGIPHEGQAQQKLRVVFANGNRSVDQWDAVAQSMLLPAVDLDGDGNKEIVVAFSGGESFWMNIYDGDDGHSVGQVTTVDADGTPLTLGGTGSSTAWASTFTADRQLVDYKWLKADPGTPPFTVKVRLWTMTDQTSTESGTTLTGPVLTRSDTTQKGCYDIKNYRLVLTLGACQ